MVEQTNGVPNFLNGDGKWVIACPCGQIHEGGGVCAEGRAAAAPGEETSSAAAGSGQQAKEDEGRPAAPTQLPAEPEQLANAPAPRGDPDGEAPSGMDEASQTAATAPVLPNRDHEEEPLAAAGNALTEDADLAAAMALSLELGQPPPTTAPAPAPVPAAAEEGLAVAPDAPALAMSEAELAEVGLDGAVVWLGKFSAALGPLRRQKRGSPQRPGGRGDLAQARAKRLGEPLRGPLPALARGQRPDPRGLRGARPASTSTGRGCRGGATPAAGALRLGGGYRCGRSRVRAQGRDIRRCAVAVGQGGPGTEA